MFYHSAKILLVLLFKYVSEKFGAVRTCAHCALCQSCPVDGLDITQNCVKLLIYITKNLLGTADLQNTVFTYTYNSGEMIRQVMMFVTKTMSTLLHVPQTN